MKTTNREVLCRAVGILEGTAYGAAQRVIDAVALACELIDSILDDDEEKEDGE